MLTKEFLLRCQFTAGMVLLLSCAQPVTKPLVETTPVASSPQPAVLVDSTAISISGYFAKPSTELFYAKRQFHPAWFTSHGLNPAADSLIALVLSAQENGLLPNDYHAESLQELKAAQEPMSIATSEILLTDAFLSFAYHMKNGRLEKSSVSRLKQQAVADSTDVRLLNDVLEGRLTVRMALESQKPSAPAYHRLEAALKDLIAKPMNRGDSSQVRNNLVKLAINMERWRWEKTKLPERHILINIPAFSLYVMEEGHVALQSRVIVGTTEKQTPQLTSQINCFVVYPYWSVPRSIATEEFLPRMQQDSNFLSSHYFDVLDRKGRVIRADTIQWSHYSKSKFPYRLRQREGDDNTLGVIKYIFDNPYGVYLHDTNEKRLFRRSVRTFSHGCIRMEKARELAHYLIKNSNARYSDADLDSLFKKRERVDVGLVTYQPILIRYFTCSVEQGRVQYYADCYDLDKRLIQALSGQ